MAWLQRVHQEAFLPHDLLLQLLAEDLDQQQQQQQGSASGQAAGATASALAGAARGGTSSSSGSSGGGSYEALSVALRGNRAAAVTLPGGATTLAFCSTGQIGACVACRPLGRMKGQGQG